MSWASRRKATYFFSILLFFGIIAVFVIFSFFYKKPTCSDGLKNGSETGVDCGGSCQRLCRADFTQPEIVWTSLQKITTSGTYNMIAYVSNPNIGYGAKNVGYNLKIYDKDNFLLFQKNGNAYISPTQNLVIFIENINLNDKVAARRVLNLDNQINWQKFGNNDLSIGVVSKELVDEETNPRLNVTLKNNSLLPIKNIESVAILYDKDDNAIGFSRTITDLIDKDRTEDIVFTWPEKFESKVFKFDIISKILPK